MDEIKKGWIRDQNKDKYVPHVSLDMILNDAENESDSFESRYISLETTVSNHTDNIQSLNTDTQAMMKELEDARSDSDGNVFSSLGEMLRILSGKQGGCIVKLTGEGGFPVGVIVGDANEIGNVKNCFRISSKGVEQSTNGFYGTFYDIISLDPTIGINASAIKSGTLEAERLPEGGVSLKFLDPLVQSIIRQIQVKPDGVHMLPQEKNYSTELVLEQDGLHLYQIGDPRIELLRLTPTGQEIENLFVRNSFDVANLRVKANTAKRFSNLNGVAEKCTSIFFGG